MQNLILDVWIDVWINLDGFGIVAIHPSIDPKFKKPIKRPTCIHKCEPSLQADPFIHPDKLNLDGLTMIGWII